MPGAARQISVSNRNEMVAVNAQQQIWAWDGMCSPRAEVERLSLFAYPLVLLGAWHQADGAAVWVSAASGHGKVYCVNAGQQVWQHAAPKEKKHVRPSSLLPLIIALTVRVL